MVRVRAVLAYAIQRAGGEHANPVRPPAKRAVLVGVGKIGSGHGRFRTTTSLPGAGRPAVAMIVPIIIAAIGPTQALLLAARPRQERAIPVREPVND